MYDATRCLLGAPKQELYPTAIQSRVQLHGRVSTAGLSNRLHIRTDFIFKLHLHAGNTNTVWQTASRARWSSNFGHVAVQLCDLHAGATCTSSTKGNIIPLDDKDH